jgi:hypothetical protein
MADRTRHDYQDIPSPTPLAGHLHRLHGESRAALEDMRPEEMTALHRRLHGTGDLTAPDTPSSRAGRVNLAHREYLRHLRAPFLTDPQLASDLAGRHATQIAVWSTEGPEPQ